MENIFVRYILEIGVFVAISIFSLEFIDNKLYIFIMGMFGYIISKTIGDIVDLIYFRNEMKFTEKNN